ncbi:MAG: family transcriptional regulator, cyclic receptor protein [Thermoanaerobaculia bacterium]|jgi:CRP-like cAMP-binding protein/tetratricopeptide (TPR) repeat protein|nr:family transcriptional regulator, cyclic receptor protein [Thermoanaerobaculia bacterium]
MAEQPVPTTPRARFRTIAAESSIPISADELIVLARRYADQGMYDEAIHLYEMAEKLKPGSVSVRINLARTRDHKEKAEASRFEVVRQDVDAQRARDEIDASQYVGLAQYYMAKDQTSKAIELLEIAKLKTPNNYRPYEILGRLHYSQGEWDSAHEEIGKARKLNPFDRGLAEIAGRVEFEKRNFERALDDFIDAFLLSTDQKGETTEPVRRMINTLKRIENIESKDLNARIKQRVEQLQTCTERLELRKDNLFKLESKKGLREIVDKITRDAETRDNLITMAADLRSLAVFQHIKDEHLIRLSKFSRIEQLAEGGQVFKEEDRSMDFYVVRDGRIEIRKDTPFGPQILGSLTAGVIFGEMNFIDRTHRSSDAVAVVPSSCYTFSFSALDQLMDEDKQLAVGLHWAFWRSLTEKVRDANEQLKLFFQEDAKKGQGRKRAEGKREVQQITVKSEDKVDLFKERGLSAGEMKLLATFSSEERIRDGSMVFREGEQGDKLYIVLDGRVRISKFIPGVGEEALAVLDRGDFFGEMALIDDKVRSADAKAHDGDATVLSIDRATLNEILSMDPHASLQFLNLLCRMISRRLREINEKIVQWKYMSGGF